MKTGVAVRQSVAVRRDRTGGWVKRLALIALVSLAGLYVLGATAGYVWVRHVRKNDGITFLDVALLRWKDVRRGFAAQQFAKAKVDWDAGNFQAAFLAYSFGVNNDPDNIPGRLAAASFLTAVGSDKMALSMLEAGLARAPEERPLIERTFDLLLASGGDRHALDLLQKRSLAHSSDANGPLLQTYELRATLNLEDPGAAKQLLEKFPELEKYPKAIPAVARVYWETQERLKAIKLLDAHVRTGSGEYAAYSQLAEWQLGVQMTDEAVHTAELACAKFPGNPAPRVLLIEAQGADSHRGREWVAGIESYLKEFGDRPQSLTLLAALAGRKGWVDLARGLYELGSMRQPDLGMLAFCYADALMRQSRFREVQQILAQVETQAAEAGSGFIAQLRHRQVIAAAALGDQLAVRDFARRLATALRNDSAGLEVSRRHFEKIGIAEAVAELSGRPTTATVVVSKK